MQIRPNPKISLSIVHEDPDLLIVDKPPGLVVQPGKGHTDDSLLNALFAQRDGHLGKLLHNLGERRDFGLLHRLDRETSGLLVIAKTPNAYDQLRRDFEDRRIDKEYRAITAGIPQPRQGVVQARLKEIEIPNPDSRSGRGTIKKSVISRQGQEAITAYKVLAETAANVRPTALVHLDIKTGRLHQIRAHMLFLNCQVLGDDIYDVPNPTFRVQDYPRAPRLCLHAARLGFKHPSLGKWVHYESPLPPDLAGYARKLGIPLPAKKE